MVVFKGRDFSVTQLCYTRKVLFSKGLRQSVLQCNTVVLQFQTIVFSGLRPKCVTFRPAQYPISRIVIPKLGLPLSLCSKFDQSGIFHSTFSLTYISLFTHISSSLFTHFSLHTFSTAHISNSLSPHIYSLLFQLSLHSLGSFISLTFKIFFR